MVNWPSSPTRSLPRWATATVRWAVRDLIRSRLGSASLRRDNWRAGTAGKGNWRVASVSYIYDHHEQTVAARVLELQHDPHILPKESRSIRLSARFTFRRAWQLEQVHDDCGALPCAKPSESQPVARPTPIKRILFSTQLLSGWGLESSRWRVSGPQLFRP